jgi:hypothetical protein
MHFANRSYIVGVRTLARLESFARPPKFELLILPRRALAG